MAIQLPYWDCGEFIACAATLSVPHPPGTPLFVLLGKFLAMLPLGGEISWRINLISVITSALAVMFAYLIVAWIVRSWYQNIETIQQRVTIYVGGVSAALFMAFSKTFWTNAVEAEVYGASMLFMMVTIFLIIKWSEHLEDKTEEKYLILFAFLSVLALGFHMTSFIVVPAAFLFILAKSKKYRTSIPIWLTFITLFMIPLSFTNYLVMSVLLTTGSTIYYYWEKMKTGWIYTLFIPAAIILFLQSSNYSLMPLLIFSLTGWSLFTIIVYRIIPGNKLWRIAMLASLMSLMGFSAQLYAPIRSAQDPPIDMTDPETWDKTISYIERKQYGSENMFVRMMTRRAELSNQFGTHPRMGFWGFFQEQYSSKQLFIPIFFLLGIVGIYFTIRQRWRFGTFMFLLCIAGTIGLVLYMNFADGTKMDQLTGTARLEVRDRDYFFTPGFMMFGLFIGLGIAAVLKIVLSYLSKIKTSKTVKNIVLTVMSFLVLLPVVSYSANYFSCDRSNNYLAYHFAMNLLNSCQENAILFTNGDNDTFPIWCLQQAYGIRKDVRVIVLSLLRTDWHIKEHKYKNNVPISFSDPEISLLRPQIDRNNNIYYISNFVTDNIIENSLVRSTTPENWPELPMKYSKFVKLDSNRINGDTTLYFDPPIHFANSVSSQGRQYKKQPITSSSVDGVIEGLVLNVYPNKREERINVDKTAEFFLTGFNCEGVNDPTIYKDENAFRISNNYWKILANMSNEIIAAGNIDDALEMNVKAVEYSTNPPEAFRFLIKNLKYSNRLIELEKYKYLIEANDKELMYAEAVTILDMLFTQDFIRYRNQLNQDQNLADSLMVISSREFINNPDYRTYLELLSEFYEKYPNNTELIKPADNIRQQVLRYLTQDELKTLDIGFLDNINSQ